MRMRCSCVEDFLRNLTDEDPNAVLRRTVHVSVTETPTVEDVRFDVVFQASCVIDMGSEGQYLLECGEACGMDYRDAGNDSSGTKRAEWLRAKVVEFCDDRGLRVRPGIVGQ